MIESERPDDHVEPGGFRSIEEIVLDISLVDSVAVAARDRTYRVALQRRERVKHRRYPFPGLVPFVLDLNGRWGGRS